MTYSPKTNLVYIPANIIPTVFSAKEYDINNGEELWKFQTGAGANAPVATYTVNGEQYVAAMAGGNSLLMSQRGDRLWAFKLGGTVPPAEAPR